jgi:hypothetical protein
MKCRKGVGGVTHMEDRRNVYAVLVKDVEGKTPLERSRRRWRNIRIGGVRLD